jgi:hypothetical protein
VQHLYTDVADFIFCDLCASELMERRNRLTEVKSEVGRDGGRIRCRCSHSHVESVGLLHSYVSLMKYCEHTWYLGEYFSFFFRQKMGNFMALPGGWSHFIETRSSSCSRGQEEVWDLSHLLWNEFLGRPHTNCIKTWDKRDKSWRQHHDSDRCAVVFIISFVSTVHLSLCHVADIVSWLLHVFTHAGVRPSLVVLTGARVSQSIIICLCNSLQLVPKFHHSHYRSM